MGQQQLLLLVLSIVLVGLAVVVGISAFGENQKKNNLDQLTSDTVRLSASVSAWKMKPNAVGGGQADITFDRLAFADLGIKPAGTGRNATYTAGTNTFRLKTFVVAGPIADIAKQQYGITDTGNALAIVGVSADRTQSVMITVFASDPSKPVTILQHPYNVSVYDAP